MKAGFYHGIYRQHRASQPAAATKHRNELLVDAESFAYIFASPNGEHQQDPLAKVKTAMLLIQKDSEARGYAPFIMRPMPPQSTASVPVLPPCRMRPPESTT